MKKFICVLVLALMFTGIACADAPEFSDWTFDQLVTLQHYLSVEIVSRPEWKETEIPAGDWVIGIDIPAGYYSVKSTHSLNIVQIEDAQGNSTGLYKTLDENEVVGKTYFPEGSTFS